MKNGIKDKSFIERLLILNETAEYSIIIKKRFIRLINDKKISKVCNSIKDKDFSEEHLKGILDNFYYLYNGVDFNFRKDGQRVLSFIKKCYFYNDDKIKNFICKNYYEVRREIDRYFKRIPLQWSKALYDLREFYIIEFDCYSYSNQRENRLCESILPALQTIFSRLYISSIINIFDIFSINKYSTKQILENEKIIKKIDDIGENLKKIPHIIIKKVY